MDPCHLMQSITVHGLLLLTAAKEERQGHGSLLLNAVNNSARVVVDCSQGGEAGAWIIVIECRL